MAEPIRTGKSTGLSGLVGKGLARQLIPLVVIVSILGVGYAYYRRYSTIHLDDRIDRGYRVLDESVREMDGRLESLAVLLDTNLKDKLSASEGCVTNIDESRSKIDTVASAAARFGRTGADVSAKSRRRADRIRLKRGEFEASDLKLSKLADEHDRSVNALKVVDVRLRELVDRWLASLPSDDVPDSINLDSDEFLTNAISRIEERLRRLAGKIAQGEREESRGQDPSFADDAARALGADRGDPAESESANQVIEAERHELEGLLTEVLTTRASRVRVQTEADELRRRIGVVESTREERRTELMSLESEPDPIEAYEARLRDFEDKRNSLFSDLRHQLSTAESCRDKTESDRLDSLVASLNRLRDYVGLQLSKRTAPEASTESSAGSASTQYYFVEGGRNSRVGVTWNRQHSVELPVSTLLDRDRLAQVFDMVLLVAPSGTVVYSQPLAQGLYGPAVLEPGIPASFEGADLEVILAARYPAPVESKAEQKPSLRFGLEDEIRRDHGRVLIERSIGGRDHTLLLKTFDFPGQSAASPKALPFEKTEGKPRRPWTLIGIARTERMQAEGSNFSLTFVLGLLGLALLGLVSLPFLKVWFIGDLDRYRYADLLWLVLSGLLGTALVAIAVIDTYRYQALLSELDAAAGALANSITSAFQRELHESVSVLNTKHKGLPREGTSAPGSRCNSDATGPEWFGTPDRRYPQFEVMFTASASGGIVGCTNVRDFATAVNRSINVTSRVYFERARDREMWRLAPATDGGKLSNPACSGTTGTSEKANCDSRSFFLESIRVWDQGAKMLALATRLPDPAEPDYAAPIVAVMLKRFVSLWVQPMAPGFGYVIVDDASGAVQVASVERKVLVENFYVESGNQRALLGAIRGRQSWLTSGSYHGRDHHFLTRPISGTPWTLVVYFDLALPRAVNFEATVWAVGILLSLYVLTALGVLILKLARPGFRGTWIWPTATSAPDYGSELISQAFIVAIGVVCACAFSTGMAIIVYIPLVFVQICIHYLLASRHVRFKRRRCRWARVILTVSYLVHLWLVYWAVVPYESDEVSVFALVGLEPALAISLWSALRWWKGELPPINPVAYGPGAIRTRFASVALMALMSSAAMPAILIHNDSFAAYYDAYKKMGLRHLGESIASAQSTYYEDAQRINEPEARKRLSQDAKPGRGRWNNQSGEPSTTCVMQSPYQHVTSVAWASLFGIEQIDYECASHARIHPVELKDGKTWAVNSEIGFPRAYAAADGLCPPTAETDKETPWLGKSDTGLTIWSDPGGFRRALHEIVPKSGLGYASEAGLIRGFMGGAATDCGWSLGHPFFYYQDPNGNLWLRVKLGRNDFPTFSDPLYPDTLSAAGSGILLIAFFGLVFGTSNRLFGMDFIGNVGVPANSLRTRRKHVLLVSGVDQVVNSYVSTCLGGAPPPSAILDLDLPSHPGVSAVKRWWPTPPESVHVIRGLESHHDDPDWSKAKLSLLERAIARGPEIPLIVISEVHPLRWLDTIDEAIAPSDAIDHRERWLNLLRRMDIILGEPPENPDWTKEADHTAAYFLRECSFHSDLRDLLQLKDQTPTLTKGQLATVVDRRAEPIHRRVWDLASPAERIVMAHMALGGIPNAANGTILRELMRRGLVSRDPDFRLSSESFSKFVAHAESHETIEMWQQEQGRDTWSVIRLPLLATLFVVLAFVVATNGDQLRSTVALVATGLGGIPVILQLVNALRAGVSSGSST